MENFKEIAKKQFNQFVSWIKQRRVYTRVSSILFLIIVLLGLCGSFVNISLSASLTGPFNSKTLATDNVKLGSISLKQFANFSNVGDISVFGKQLDEYKIGGVSIYDSLQKERVSHGYLDSAIDVLTPQNLSVLTNPELSKELKKISPKYGEDIANTVNSVGEILLKSRDALVSVNNIVSESRDSLNDVGATINQIEGYKTTANWFVFIIFVLIVISIVLLCLPKISKKITLGLCYLNGAIIVCFSIGVYVINNIINTNVQAVVAQTNGIIAENFTAIAKSILGENAGFIKLFGGTNTNFVDFNLFIHLGAGAIIAIIAFICAIIAIHFIPKNDELQDAKVELEAVTN